MLGGNGQQRKAQGMEFRQHHVFAFHAVHLVHHNKHRLARSAQVNGQMLVKGSQAVAAVHHQADHRAFGHGLLGLPENIFLKAAQATRPFHSALVPVHRHPAGIHQNKRGFITAAHHAFHAIPRDAGAVVRNGPFAADQSVEQRGLAHIGTAHQNDFGQGRTEINRGHGTPPARGDTGRHELLENTRFRLIACQAAVVQRQWRTPVRLDLGADFSCLT